MAKRTGGLSLQSLIAAVVTLLAVVLAIGFLLTANGGGGDVARTTAQADAPRMFPDLADGGERIQRIRIDPPGEDAAGVTLHLADGAWHVAELADYPVVRGRVAAFLDTLVDARRLGEASPGDVAETMGETGDSGATERAGWRRITLADGDGNTVLAGRIGPQVSSPKARDLSATYVSAGGGETVWLADLELERDIADARNWVEPEILGLARERIAAVRTAPLSGEPLHIRRIEGATGEFEAVGLTRELMADTAWKIGDLTVPFTDLAFRQVRKTDDADGAWPGFVKTTDGLVLRFAVTKADDGYWARFKLDASEMAPTEDRAGDDGDAATAPARDLDALRARIQGRMFQLPDYTANRMIRPRESLESDRGEDAQDGTASDGAEAVGSGASANDGGTANDGGNGATDEP
jgi:hypothetical protein